MYPFFNYLPTLIYAGIKNTVPVEFIKFFPHLCKVTVGLAQIMLKFCSCSFCFSSHTYNNENTSVSLSLFPGDKCSIPDTMLSYFTSTRPSRLEVCLSLFLVGFIYRLCQKHIPDTFNKVVVLVVGPFTVPSN